MPTLTIIRGLPGSGKSTLARKIAADTGAIHIEPDMFCIQDAEYRYNPEKYAKAFENARAIISRLAYNMECDIIFADVLPQTGQVASFRYLIPSNYKLVVQDLHISKEESLQRNKHNVRPEDIEAMAGAWQNWYNQEVKL
jgi:adenylate kinase family enzyme